VENEIGPKGEVELTKLNGKPVTSVVGEFPLHAWGKALTKLGLIDEIMYLRAIEAVQVSRLEGLKDAKDRLEGKTPVKSPEKKKGSESQPASRAPSPMMDGEVTKTEEKKDADGDKEEIFDPDREPPSAGELELRAKLDALKAELHSAQEEDHKAAIALANDRIHDLGPFLCNPFLDEETGKSMQGSWLATAVRKEKTRMGSTGNRKKVVTAVDLLERNDTFFNSDIEAFIEGLPGSEFCGPYVFQAFRSGGSGAGALNRAWIHDAQMKNEQEAENRLKRSREALAKEEQTQEKELKRRKRDEIRDSKKRQRDEEEEEKRKQRADERMSRLEVQINDRLNKDAAFQREKVVVSLAKLQTKEFARRRKAAEIVAAQTVVEVKTVKSNSVSATSLVVDLPSPTNVYNEDAVRVWNFMSTFQSYFLQKEYVSEVPTLPSLQTAVDCIQGKATKSTLSCDEAVSLLTDLSIALCKPLAASLTRILFSSLIGLNPNLQKDFGAAFFNAVNSTNGSKEGEDQEKDNGASVNAANIILPVNELTWQEIARMSFLSDALGELGQSNQDSAHVLRGYRSAGHPNSSKSITFNYHSVRLSVIFPEFSLPFSLFEKFRGITTTPKGRGLCHCDSETESGGRGYHRRKKGFWSQPYTD